jgi:DNA-binding response OmpR family regulator
VESGNLACPPYSFIGQENNSSQVNNAVPTKVLVIDDDADTTAMLRLILEPNAYDVNVSHSGPEGIKTAHLLNPEVIILDLSMSDMDSWQVCKEIRAFSQVPILVLSAISNPGMVAKALDEGADDFLLKPMTSSVLIAHMKRLVWRARAEKGANNHKQPGTKDLKAAPSPGSAVHRQTEPRARGKEIGAIHATRPSTTLKDIRVVLFRKMRGENRRRSRN